MNDFGIYEDRALHLEKVFEYLNELEITLNA